MNVRRYILYILAVICMIGGIMGIVKGIFPNVEWLSFRYLLNGDGTYAIGEMPVYARIYGIIMGCLEVASSIIIFKWEKSLFLYAIVAVIINMLGCIIDFILGDMFAIVSLILRFIPLYFLVVENQNK